MTEHPEPWTNTTHDWAVTVDRHHLGTVRRDPGTYAPGGTSDLVLEVLAYADDEAAALGRRGRALVTLHGDGSVSVADDGRGTDTRRDPRGVAVRKPVMSTRDLRFFGVDHDVLLPNGRPRQGISVVAALSSWLIHTNRRPDGSWTQRYEHGIPSAGLAPAEGGGATGTTVRFLGDPGLVPVPAPAPDGFLRDTGAFPWLVVEVVEG